MKFLLTSAGIANKSIEDAFLKLIGKPFNETKLAFIPTASNVEPGDKWWLIDDLVKLRELGFKEIDIVDISAVPENLLKERLENADVLFFEGGNDFHLMCWINKLNLREYFVELLNMRLWVGVSAGSMVTGQKLSVEINDKLYGEEAGDGKNMHGLNFVSFDILPHLDSNDGFPEMKIENIEKLIHNFDSTVYAIDDNTAIIVDGDRTEVVSEGTWRKF